jgi:hypothetical protein
VAGWQITLDLGYLHPAVDQDSWAPMHTSFGQGRRRAPDVVNGGSATGALLVNPDADPLATAVWLRDHQDEWLPSSWQTTRWEAKPRLTLADVEHTLCELARYWKLRSGARTRQRRFP